jgi:hypothetical protein
MVRPSKSPPGGTLIVLHTFNGKDGKNLYGGLPRAPMGGSTGQPTLAEPTMMARSSAWTWGWARSSKPDPPPGRRERL